MKYSMIVFDMAGTTVEDLDNAVASRLCEALGAVGAKVSIPMVDPVMGIPKPIAIRALLCEARGDAPADSEVQAVHADFQNRIVEHYRHGPHVREMPGASALFEALRRSDVRVTLDTGFDRRTLDTIVERLGWADLVDDAIASDQVERGRPDPQMIHVLMERAGERDPSRVAKVGDSVSDLEQGTAAGCGFLGAVLNDRTRPVLHRFPGLVPLGNLAEVIPALSR